MEHSSVYLLVDDKLPSSEMEYQLSGRQMSNRNLSVKFWADNTIQSAKSRAPVDHLQLSAASEPKGWNVAKKLFLDSRTYHIPDYRLNRHHPHRICLLFPFLSSRTYNSFLLWIDWHPLWECAVQLNFTTDSKLSQSPKMQHFNPAFSTPTTVRICLNKDDNRNRSPPSGVSMQNFNPNHQSGFGYFSRAATQAAAKVGFTAESESFGLQLSSNE